MPFLVVFYISQQNYLLSLLIAFVLSTQEPIWIAELILWANFQFESILILLSALLFFLGPLESTAVDFWQMVWTTGASIIIMLTK